MKKAFLYAYDRQNLGDDLFVHTITGRYPNTQFYMWSDRKNRETFSFLPNQNIWLAATVAAVVLIVALLGIYVVSRKEKETC